MVQLRVSSLSINTRRSTAPPWEGGKKRSCRGARVYRHGRSTVADSVTTLSGAAGESEAMRSRAFFVPSEIAVMAALAVIDAPGASVIGSGADSARYSVG